MQEDLEKFLIIEKELAQLDAKHALDVGTKIQEHVKSLTLEQQHTLLSRHCALASILAITLSDTLSKMVKEHLGLEVPKGANKGIADTIIQRHAIQYGLDMLHALEHFGFSLEEKEGIMKAVYREEVANAFMVKHKEVILQEMDRQEQTG